MNSIEANIIRVLALLSYMTFSYRSNFMKNFSSTVRIHESTLMSSIMRHLRKSEILAVQKK